MGARKSIQIATSNSLLKNRSTNYFFSPELQAHFVYIDINIFHEKLNDAIFPILRSNIFLWILKISNQS